MGESPASDFAEKLVQFMLVFQQWNSGSDHAAQSVGFLILERLLLCYLDILLHNIGDLGASGGPSIADESRNKSQTASEQCKEYAF